MRYREALLETIFEERSHPLKPVISDWLSSSRRFADFVDTYQNKIRKKLRAAATSGVAGDLQLELETAYLLLREISLGVTYEPEHRVAGRSPDFAVGFTTSLTFMVEVTRIRRVNLVNGAVASDRITDVLCDKLGQMRAQRSNLLVIGIESMTPSINELQAVITRMRQQAERNDPQVISRHGFQNRAGFFEKLQRMSAVMVRGVPMENATPVILWENKHARDPLPAKVRTALVRSHTL